MSLEGKLECYSLALPEIAVPFGQGHLHGGVWLIMCRLAHRPLTNISCGEILWRGWAAFHFILTSETSVCSRAGRLAVCPLTALAGLHCYPHTHKTNNQPTIQTTGSAAKEKTSGLEQMVAEKTEIIFIHRPVSILILTKVWLSLSLSLINESNRIEF